jgi:hypothetical protein
MVPETTIVGVSRSVSHVFPSINTGNTETLHTANASGKHWETVETPRWVITIQATPKGKDHLGRSPEYRLKNLLKTMLRGLGFRCVEVKPGEPGSREN